MIELSINVQFLRKKFTYIVPVLVIIIIKEMLNFFYGWDINLNKK